jgi:bifunctional UDP-N-acetylglucosamine pyrophosphorylase/glucosamine-1-phosphate N-acetyltransferase
MLNFIILGAGKGTRMKSSVSKVLHKIAGYSLIEIIISLAKSFNPKQIIAVTSDENDDTIKGLNIETTIQEHKLGTGHAVLQALPNLSEEGKTFILYGDTPLITKTTLDKMQKVEADIVVLGFNGDLNERYGRLVVKGEVVEEIVEFKDLKEHQKNINIFNSGVFLVKSSLLKNIVPQISNQNNSGEYYLTDIVKIANKLGSSVKFILCEKNEVLGVNTMEELAIAESLIQTRLRSEHLLNGVQLIDPATVFFSLDTKISSDVIIEPNVIFKNGVTVHQNSTIKAFCYLEECEIHSGTHIGPFARIRGKTTIGENSKIGNFVEVKNSTLGAEVKAGHLAYIGDAEVGSDVNIGAGVVFCNYDGKNKHKTIIKSKSFLGSNSSLVAPLTVGENSLVGAGSVITDEVPDNSLAIERTAQKNIIGYRKK